MQEQLPHIPLRQEKPRSRGCCMVMDKGLGLSQASALIESSGHLIDFVKLGFGTSVVSTKVKEKVELYRSAGIHVYVGGTLFEAFWIRNMIPQYRKYIQSLGMDAVEISDGSVIMAHAEKCRYIADFSNEFIVLSEVGRKDAGQVLTNDVWVNEMEAELKAGSRMVIAESRESGTVGIYDDTGKPNLELIGMIESRVSAARIMWEAPLKSQQAWLIKHFGPEVHLGNIAPDEVIALETLRLGLRGDTFFNFLPDELRAKEPV